ncbi:hypothetical protein ACHAW5_007766 [Stephanodiscus triporus]|uniref:Methyltransferase FkbM domain-containing protein n=1 Tax=Stephanodiscus triporus TaxID=2934178 RepID=A0ABD3MVV3_9STRA
MNYRHDNLNLQPEKECTEEQRNKINQKLGLESGNVQVAGCNDPDWLDSFFEEEADIGTASFLGISVGCNKGTDAVQMARLGMSDLKINVSAWTEFLGSIITVCPAREQGPVNFPKRNGEMHCIEPMLNNIILINNASQHLGLDSKEFVVTQAAISARNGVVKFPNADAGAEACGLQGCEGWVAGAENAFVEAPVYSLDSYVEKFISSKGPINLLAIDAEGWDFDALFGASSVLDRTYYLEFEYHMIGMPLLTLYLSPR